MNKVLILLALVGVALAIPVRLRPRYTLSDATCTKMTSTTNAKYSGGLFLIGGQKVSYIAAGALDATTVVQAGGTLEGIAVHPTAEKLYVSYTRSATSAEATANAGVTKMAVVSEYTLSATVTGSNERVLLTQPMF
eukprot:PhM_4_TR13867/c0_g1_i1/m.74779